MYENLEAVNPEITSFAIFEATRDRFMSLAERDALGIPIDLKAYDCVYEDDSATPVTLEEIFSWFNIGKPCEFFGRSLSVGDIVFDCENSKCYYCDSFGFFEVHPSGGKYL